MAASARSDIRSYPDKIIPDPACLIAMGFGRRGAPPILFSH
jgi:hypothetical protein